MLRLYSDKLQTSVVESVVQLLHSLLERLTSLASNSKFHADDKVKIYQISRLLLISLPKIPKNHNFFLKTNLNFKTLDPWSEWCPKGSRESSRRLSGICAAYRQLQSNLLAALVTTMDGDVARRMRPVPRHGAAKNLLSATAPPGIAPARICAAWHERHRLRPKGTSGQRIDETFVSQYVVAADECVRARGQAEK